MIQTDDDFRAARARIERLQRQLEHLRRVETNSTNYRLSASGFLAGLDRMNLVEEAPDDSAALTVAYVELHAARGTRQCLSDPRGS